MNTVLAPIIHKDAYTKAVESELLAWMREAIFTPLLIAMGNADVPMSPQYQAIRFDEEGRANAADWKLFPPAFGSLGLERIDMPQVTAAHRGALISFLRARDITYDAVEVAANSLRPTQAGYYPDKVAKQAARTEPGPAIMVSSDGYLVDGHHQWMAAMQADPTGLVRVLMFHERIRPLMAAINQFPSVEHHNATTSAVRAALQSGRIHYADGVFSGSFSAAISKELKAMGATFGADRNFHLVASRLPLDITAAVLSSAQQSAALHKEVTGILDAIEMNVAQAGVSLTFNTAVDLIVGDLQRQFISTVKGVETVAVTGQVDEGMRKRLTAELTENTNLSIKNFVDDRIPEMRRRVEQNAFEGGRTDRLARILEAEFGVSKRKADFLADQETGLLVSKYRELRYASAGITEYIWSTSHDIRVRHDHRLLDGKRFSYANPPVTNRATGARNNPGEDYRCRCVPKPVLARVLQTA